MLMFLLLAGAVAALAIIPRYLSDQRRWRHRQSLREMPAGKTFLF